MAYIYVFVRDSHIIGVLVDMATPHSGRLWYVGSLKWSALLLITICINAGKHLVMLTPAVVQAARPYLAWSTGMAATPLILGYMVRANISTVSVTCAVDSALPAAHRGTVITRDATNARPGKWSCSKKPTDKLQVVQDDTSVTMKWRRTLMDY